MGRGLYNYKVVLTNYPVGHPLREHFAINKQGAEMIARAFNQPAKIVKLTNSVFN